MLNSNKKADAPKSEFNALAKDWWNPNGSFKMLHKYNKVRIPYIIHTLKQHFAAYNLPLSQLKILDVGCGGGLVTEELAKKGANMTGIDTSSKSIETAKNHALSSKLSINYFNKRVEDLEASTHAFDVILILEVLEHVDNLAGFLGNLLPLLKDNGIVIFSTINRNIKSLLLAKIAAEYILRWLPKGIHEYQKFIKPFELENLFSKHGFHINNLTGIKYNILHNAWEVTNNVDINYMGSAVKQ